MLKIPCRVQAAAIVETLLAQEHPAAGVLTDPAGARPAHQLTRHSAVLVSFYLTSTA